MGRVRPLLSHQPRPAASRCARAAIISAAGIIAGLDPGLNWPPNWVGRAPPRAAHRVATAEENDMRSQGCPPTMSAAAAAAMAALALLLAPEAAQAQQKAIVMKITTPTLNAAPDLYAKAFGAA